MVMLTVSQARASLPELLTRVEDGEQVTITRHGRPVAVLVRPDVIRSRADVIIEDAGRIHDLLAAAAASQLPGERAERGGHEDPGRPGEPAGHGLTIERAEELISEIRAGRDAR
jgi:antitoxin (DNA-binding transcriptional repressor) of toxin-antitoxin stability system